MNYMRLAVAALLFSIVSIQAMESDPGKEIYDYCTLPDQDLHNQAVEIFEDSTIKEIRVSLATISNIDRTAICEQLFASKAFPEIKALFQAIKKQEPKSTINPENNENVAENYLDFLIYFQKAQAIAFQKDKEAKEKEEKEKIHYLKPMHFIHWGSEK